MVSLWSRISTILAHPLKLLNIPFLHCIIRISDRCKQAAYKRRVPQSKSYDTV